MAGTWARWGRRGGWCCADEVERGRTQFGASEARREGWRGGERGGCKVWCGW